MRCSICRSMIVVMSRARQLPIDHQTQFRSQLLNYFDAHALDD